MAKCYRNGRQHNILCCATYVGGILPDKYLDPPPLFDDNKQPVYSDLNKGGAGVEFYLKVDVDGPLSLKVSFDESKLERQPYWEGDMYCYKKYDFLNDLKRKFSVKGVLPGWSKRVAIVSLIMGLMDNYWDQLSNLVQTGVLKKYDAQVRCFIDGNIDSDTKYEGTEYWTIKVRLDDGQSQAMFSNDWQVDLDSYNPTDHIFLGNLADVVERSKKRKSLFQPLVKTSKTKVFCDKIGIVIDASVDYLTEDFKAASWLKVNPKTFGDSGDM